jgi:hypothetical protein
MSLGQVEGGNQSKRQGRVYQHLKNGAIIFERDPTPSPSPIGERNLGEGKNNQSDRHKKRDTLKRCVPFLLLITSA